MAGGRIERLGVSGQERVCLRRVQRPKVDRTRFAALASEQEVASIGKEARKIVALRSSLFWGGDRRGRAPRRRNLVDRTIGSIREHESSALVPLPESQLLRAEERERRPPGHRDLLDFG